MIEIQFLEIVLLVRATDVATDRLHASFLKDTHPQREVERKNKAEERLIFYSVI